MQYTFTLTGKSPLLVHADDVERSGDLEVWRKDHKNKGISKSGDDRSPAWTWQTYCYSDGERLTVPSDNLSTCLREAGAMILMQGKKTFKQASQSGLLFGEEHLPLIVNGNEIKSSDIDDMRDDTFDEQRIKCRGLGFELFVKRAKIGQAKHVRVRPRFNNWSLTGTVEVMAKEITSEVLQEMFSIAGRYKGLCDWRPSSKQSPGRFGMFEAVVKKA